MNPQIAVPAVGGGGELLCDWRGSGVTHSHPADAALRGGSHAQKAEAKRVFDQPPSRFLCLQPFSKKAVDHVQSHLAKKQVPPNLFQVTSGAARPTPAAEF